MTCHNRPDGAAPIQRFPWLLLKNLVGVESGSGDFETTLLSESPLLYTIQNAALAKGDNAVLQDKVKNSDKESFKKLMEEAQLRTDYENLQRVMEKIPPEIVFMYAGRRQSHDKTRDQER